VAVNIIGIHSFRETCSRNFDQKMLLAIAEGKYLRCSDSDSVDSYPFSFQQNIEMIRVHRLKSF
jgi:hypothetical protein